MSSDIRMPKNKFLVRRLDPEEKSPGGIEIPKSAQKRVPRGVVVEVGVHEDLGVEVSIGDIVAFASYDGTVVEVGGEKLLILKTDDILLVLKQ